jgi:DNA mismatch repair protein MutL
VTQREASDAGIDRLPEAAIRHIAAGEVVTRPAAVVKELVENAVDAGASRVEVAVENGGLDRIEVRDDGHGMRPAAAPRAFERYATSKVGDVEDVAAVETLGFRGEALAAIADAGDVELVTKADGARGVRATPDGTVETAPRGVGTTVVVRDLFADRPARRESLATPRTEFSRVADVCTRYALTHPDLRIRLEHDGSRTFETPGSGEYADALLATYDRELAGQALEFEDERDGVAVSGTVVSPAVTRAKPSHVSVAVNGRALRESAIRDAVIEGYGDLLPGDRYPVAAVAVKVDPAEVDANVHPAKTDVAFTDPDRVTRAVERAVADRLSTADLARAAAVTTDLEADVEPLEGGTPFGELSVIGVFRELYVLCERGDELLVIDAHAAHERVTVERLRAAVADREVPSVSLDPPVAVRLAPAERGVLEDARETVRRLGYEVTLVGDGTARVGAVPAPVGRVAAPESLRDVLDRLRAGEDLDVREDLLGDLACHPSLSAGDDLDRERAERLLERLGACEQPYACPHGRPTVLSIEEATLARGFDRPNTRFD